MAIKLNIRKLKGYLWHLGPFIYYYNGHLFQDNKEIVENMQIMAHKWPKLKVFEICWNDQMNFMPQKIENMNTIYLYFRGQLKISKLNPNLDDIKGVFAEAINYYNKNRDLKARNVGIKSNIKALLNTIPKNNEEKLKLKQYIDAKYSRKRYFINGKIKINNDASEHCNKSYIDKNKKSNKLFMYDKNKKQKHNLLESNLDTDTPYVLNDKSLSSKPWFYDIKIYENPLERLLDEPITNYNYFNIKNDKSFIPISQNESSKHKNIANKNLYQNFKYDILNQKKDKNKEASYPIEFFHSYAKL